MPAEPFFIRKVSSNVAKVSVGEFVRQVRSEGIEKVHWPSAADTRRTALMVILMTSLLGVFFLGTDSTFSAIVQYLLSLLG